jgi:vacuolar-type H+-ATPase subunit E/Vma4
MSLENILDQIKQEAEQEINLLEKEADLAIKQIDQENQKQIDCLTKENEKKLTLEKEKRINNYLKEKQFQAEMEILKLKNQLVSQAAGKIKQKLKEKPEQEIKEILKKEVDKINKIDKKDCFVWLPVNKKNLYIDLFKEIPNEKIIEKQLDFDQGFIVENNKFVLKVDLAELIDEKILEEKQLFFHLLFN